MTNEIGSSNAGESEGERWLQSKCSSNREGGRSGQWLAASLSAHYIMFHFGRFVRG